MGLPHSSSHALIGSIIGVGVANQWLAPAGSATSGVDWEQAIGVFKTLLFSPVIGFVSSALLFLAMKYMISRSQAVHVAGGTDASTVANPHPARADLHGRCRRAPRRPSRILPRRRSVTWPDGRAAALGLYRSSPLGPTATGTTVCGRCWLNALIVAARSRQASFAA